MIALNGDNFGKLRLSEMAHYLCEPAISLADQSISTFSHKWSQIVSSGLGKIMRFLAYHGSSLSEETCYARFQLGTRLSVEDLYFQRICIYIGQSDQDIQTAARNILCFVFYFILLSHKEWQHTSVRSDFERQAGCMRMKEKGVQRVIV